MLNDIFRLYADSDAFNAEAQEDIATTIAPSFLLHPDAEQQIRERYRFCSENNLQAFALSIVAGAPLSPVFLEQLCSFFFIPSYYRSGGHRVVALLGNNEALLAHAAKMIREQARLQGIVNVHVHYPVLFEKVNLPGGIAQKKAGYLFSDNTAFKDHYAALMKTSDPYNHVFYLQPGADPGIKGLAAAIEGAEEMFKKNQPALYELTVNLRRLTSENDVLQQKYQAAENELKNYQSHLEILRSGHQAKELQDYYNNEYEILPRWYKRIGQLVKVMIGRRSAKSLFNDQVKKYKH